jgi:hypothetical protein
MTNEDRERITIEFMGKPGTAKGKRSKALQDLGLYVDIGQTGVPYWTSPNAKNNPDADSFVYADGLSCDD